MPEAKLLPDNVPQVSFAVDLGERVSYIDFDYFLFQEEAENKGVPDADVENFAFNVHKGKLGNLAIAKYEPEENEVSLGVRTIDHDRLIERRAAHELGHFFREKSGQNTQFDKVVNNLTNSCLYATILFTVYGQVLHLISEMQDNLNLADASTELTYVSAGMSITFLMLYLVINRDERAARQYARTSQRILTVSK